MKIKNPRNHGFVVLPTLPDFKAGIVDALALLKVVLEAGLRPVDEGQDLAQLVRETRAAQHETDLRQLRARARLGLSPQLVVERRARGVACSRLVLARACQL